MSRLLCGVLLVMALLDVPVAGWPETGRLVGGSLLLGVLAGVAVMLRRRGGTEIPLERTTRLERKSSLIVPKIRWVAGVLAFTSLAAGAVCLAWLLTSA
jgi:hypothetical protein